MLISLKAQTVSYEDRVLYLLEDGLVNVTEADNIHPYSSVKGIILSPRSNLSRSPSASRHLLILTGLLKHHPFNQPMIERPWLLALQQCLSQYLVSGHKFRQCPFRFAGSWKIVTACSSSANQGTRATVANYIRTGLGTH